jgi:hypothetical protein
VVLIPFLVSSSEEGNWTQRRCRKEGHVVTEASGTSLGMPKKARRDRVSLGGLQ